MLKFQEKFSRYDLPSEGRPNVGRYGESIQVLGDMTKNEAWLAISNGAGITYTRIYLFKQDPSTGFDFSSPAQTFNPESDWDSIEEHVGEQMRFDRSHGTKRLLVNSHSLTNEDGEIIVLLLDEDTGEWNHSQTLTPAHHGEDDNNFGEYLDADGGFVVVGWGEGYSRATGSTVWWTIDEFRSNGSIYLYKWNSSSEEYEESSHQLGPPIAEYGVKGRRHITRPSTWSKSWQGDFGKGVAIDAKWNILVVREESRLIYTEPSPSSDGYTQDMLWVFTFDDDFKLEFLDTISPPFVGNISSGGPGIYGGAPFGSGRDQIKIKDGLLVVGCPTARPPWMFDDTSNANTGRAFAYYITPPADQSR